MIETFHVGDMMYGEGKDIRPGRILDLPLSRLTALRRNEKGARRAPFVNFRGLCDYVF